VDINPQGVHTLEGSLEPLRFSWYNGIEQRLSSGFVS
jgi:hypothetical protein